MKTYLTLMLGKECFAVPVTLVLEVLQKRQITHIPKTPKHILGIINFRGDILSVIDTRQKFNLGLTSEVQNYVVIVFEITNTDNSKTLIAATADSVKDVIEIEEENIKSVPELGLNYDSRFITGALHSEEGFILLLDIEKVFSAQEMLINMELTGDV